ncbi:MAG TPA: thiosulfate oxidation carrier protein SoxY [Burkholderiales bacterium]|nr:thiosulfate oxidation carrier protein SoxY [Burkholderiales bacterium]
MRQRLPDSPGRRHALRLLGTTALAGGAVLAGWISRAAEAQSTAALGMPQPDEKVADTLRRLFGNRPIQPAGDRIKLEAPMIAENGAVVPVRVEVDLPMTKDDYVRNIYIISDKNRRPLNAQFTLTPESGKASVGTNIRLASTTDVRAIAETSKGALYEAKREVKVTVGGCGG